MKPGTSPDKQILTVNGGSSSIKFALFEVDGAPRRILSGKIARIGLSDPEFSVSGLAPAGTAGSEPDVRPGGILSTHGQRSGAINQPHEASEPVSQPVKAPDHAAAVAALMDWLQDRLGQTSLAGVGHRVVHGGPRYWEPQRITPELVRALHELTPFDPEHLPEEILLVEAFGRRFPALPQIACFDTAFHHDLPRVARLLPIPRRYEAMGVRRYGFHGLSCAFMMEELERVAGEAAARGKIVLAHLGNGASVTAVRSGKSLDTSMGFTPAAGVPMGTRSGDLDPGLLWYLARAEGMDPQRFNQMIHSESGLLGVSETSSDMHDLLQLESQDARAAEAVDLFCYEIKKRIGAFAAALGGLDTLVFAGGIGENAPVVRARICGGLEFLGVQLEAKRNELNAALISPDAGRVAVRVIRTDEERMIAQMVWRVLGLGNR